ncbi:hypothetical protein [Metabacillus idriensis]|nr:hypothetical protein [Metabacillus idriensis]
MIGGFIGFDGFVDGGGPVVGSDALGFSEIFPGDKAIPSLERLKS